MPSREFAALREGSVDPRRRFDARVVTRCRRAQSDCAAMAFAQASVRSMRCLTARSAPELAARLENAGRRGHRLGVQRLYRDRQQARAAHPRRLRRVARAHAGTFAARPDAGQAGRNHRGDARRRCEARGARGQPGRRGDDDQRISRLARGRRRLDAPAIVGRARRRADVRRQRPDLERVERGGSGTGASGGSRRGGGCDRLRVRQGR